MSFADITEAAKLLTAPTPSVASIEAQGKKEIQGWFNFPLNWGGHLLLALPYMWGINGVNILAATSGKDSAFAMAKAAFYWGCKLLSDYLSVEFGDQWWEPPLRYVLLYANPWYIFDVLQVFSPYFKEEGYKLPFTDYSLNSKLRKGATTHPSSEKDFGWKYTDANGVQQVSYGWMGPVAIGAAITLLVPALYSIFGALPSSVSSGYVAILNSVMLVIGGVAALGSGGLGAMVVFPALKDRLTTYLKPTEMAAPTVPPPTSQKGGDGNAFPSVESVAKSLLKKSQSGGGRVPRDSTTDYLFFGILGTVVVGGMTLAALRLKLSSGSLVE